MSDVALAIRAQMDAQEAVTGLSDISDAASSMSTDVTDAASSAADAAAQIGDISATAKDVSSNAKQASGSLNAMAGGLDLIGASGAADTLRTVGDVTKTVAGVGKGLNLVLKAQAVQSALVKTGLIAQTAATEAQAVATEAGTVAQEGLNVAILANPVGLIIIAVVALVAAIVILYKKSETFRDIVNGAFRSVSKVVGEVVSFIKDHWKLLFVILTGPIGLAVLLIAKHWDEIKAGGAAVVDWVRDHFGDVKELVTRPFSDAKALISDVWSAITGAISSAKSTISTVMADIKSDVQAVVDVFQNVIDKVQAFIDKVKSAASVHLPFGIGGRTSVGGAALGTAGGIGNALGFTHQPEVHVHLHNEGTTYVGNDMDLARKLGQVLKDNRRAIFGPA